MSDFGASVAWLSFLAIAVLLTAFLSFGLPLMVAMLCHLAALSERQCFSSSDETVWWFALPLVAFPAYLVCMFIGRSRGESGRALAVQGAGDPTGHDPYSAGARAALSMVFALIGLLLLAVAISAAIQGPWQKAATFLVFSAGAGFAAYGFRRKAVRAPSPN